MLNRNLSSFYFLVSVTILVLFRLDLGGAQNSTGALNFNNNYRNMRVRLNNRQSGSPATGSSTIVEGRVEVSFDDGRSWGSLCSTNWGFREGNVVCRQLGLGSAEMSKKSTQYGNSRQNPWGMVGTLCRGNERRLQDCMREPAYPTNCTAQNMNVAVVRCVRKMADLSLGLKDIQTSVRLESVPMNRLTCAMEENCVSADAYVIRRTNPNAERKLLRFTTRADNVGTADFSPYANYRDWTWHQCHQHYHSMNVFATFDIYNLKYEKVAQGHKASFCLMDVACQPGVSPKYTCGNQTQGISIGCADLYYANLDCQWVDVTTLPPNDVYILRVALNPEYLIGEISYENNGAECLLRYTGDPATTKIINCVRAPLWFRSTRV